MSETSTSKNHVATFVDAMRRIHGVDPPKQIRTRVGVEAGRLMREGVDPVFIARGVEMLAEKGIDPSMLPSLVFTAQTERVNAEERKERELLARFLEANGVRWPTGCVFVRGSMSGTYKQETLGCDKPPYEVPWNRPSRDAVVAALKALDAAGVDITTRGIRAPHEPT